MVLGRLPDSRVPLDRVSGAEKWLGYLIGPIAALLMQAVCGYCNIYYTDVLALSGLWRGAFLTLLPIVSKGISVVCYLFFGKLSARTRTSQGSARPWLLLSAPLLSVGMILMFLIPKLSPTAEAVWVLVSYNLFYSGIWTVYSLSHTMLVPLATRDPAVRDGLAVRTSAQGMAAGAVSTVLFPMLILPFIGVNQGLWIRVMVCIALACLPFTLLEYFFTRERVEPSPQAVSLSLQWKTCIRDGEFRLMLVFMLMVQIMYCASAATNYYCNWVLGSYNDGLTIPIYYVIGNLPLGLGMFVVPALSRRIRKTQLMGAGFLLGVLGSAVSLLAPGSLPVVLAGQFIRAIGLIPCSFLMPAVLGELLEGLEERHGIRCDSLVSTVYNSVSALAAGLMTGLLNLGLGGLGYVPPVSGQALPVQNRNIQGFFTGMTLGVPGAASLILTGLLAGIGRQRSRRKAG